MLQPAYGPPFVVIVSWLACIRKPGAQCVKNAGIEIMHRRANHDDVGKAQAISASESNRIARSVSVFRPPTFTAG